MHRAVLRLEGLLWMTRPSSLLTALMAIPGWLASSGASSYGRLAAMVGAMALARAVTNIVNDILDEEKDRVTAPHLPLPSGMVTLPQAALAAGTISLSMLALLGIAGGSVERFLIGCAGIVLGGVSIGCYSFVKDRALLAMAVTASAYLSFPITAWLVGGGGGSAGILAIVLAYTVLRGSAAYVFSTYRDVDSDGEVGNRSIAVRLGASRALALGVALEVLAMAGTIAIAVRLDRVALGAIVAGVSVALLVVAYLATARRRSVGEGRHRRSIAMLPLAIARQHVGIVFVQSVPVGIAAAAVTAVVIAFEAGLYDRRVVHGGLRGELEGERLPAVSPVGAVRVVEGGGEP